MDVTIPCIYTNLIYLFLLTELYCINEDVLFCFRDHLLQRWIRIISKTPVTAHTGVQVTHILIKSITKFQLRGEEVPVALDFVRGMDEEGLKLLLEQGEVSRG